MALIKRIIQALRLLFRGSELPPLRIESKLEIKPELGKEYSLFIVGPGIIQIFADLSNLVAGDRIVLEEYFFPDGRKMLFNVTTIEGPVSPPLASFPLLETPWFYEIKLKQTFGVSKELKFWLGRK